MWFPKRSGSSSSEEALFRDKRDKREGREKDSRDLGSEPLRDGGIC
jgi:hypothetical protein